MHGRLTKKNYLILDNHTKPQDSNAVKTVTYFHIQNSCHNFTGEIVQL